MGDNDAALDPAEDSRLLIISIIDVGDVLEDAEYLGHKVPVRHLHAPAGVIHGGGNVGHLPGNTVGIEDQVHKPRGDGAVGHAVEFGAFGRLDDDHPVLLLDGPDAVGAVRPGAGQDDRYAPVLIGLGQGAEEYVDRVIDMLVVIFRQMQFIALDLQVVFGRDHVDMILLDPHTVDCFDHRHGGILAQDLPEQALMVGREVLDDDIGHIRIPGQEGKELLQGFQAAGRRADADDTSGLIIFSFFTSIKHIDLTVFIKIH